MNDSRDLWNHCALPSWSPSQETHFFLGGTQKIAGTQVFLGGPQDMGTSSHSLEQLSIGTQVLGTSSTQWVARLGRNRLYLCL